MEDKKLKELEEQLLKEKQTLEEDLSSIAKKDPHAKGAWDTKFSRVPEGGLEEEEDEVEEYTNNLAIEQSLAERLGLVTEALNRIKEGTYGICKNCNEQISEERLEAAPATLYCINCMNKHK